MKKALTVFLLVLTLSGAFFPVVAASSKTLRLKTVITPGVLIADVRDANGNSIPEPTLDLGKVVNSINCRTEEVGLKGTLGDQQGRIYVDNPKATFDGWTLTIAAADGSSSFWQGERPNHKFDYNDAGGNGCVDSDGDGLGGLLTIDPTGATLRSDCQNCSTDYIAIDKTDVQTFAETPSITLLNASDLSDVIGSWYLTGIKLLQTVPSAQDGDNYYLDLVLTATAS